MAFDYSSKGWVLNKWTERKGRIDCFIERKTTLDNKVFENVLENSVQNLKSKFPNLRIKVEYKRRVQVKSIEIIGMPLKDDEDMMFSIWMTTKKINVRLSGIDPDILLDCIS